MGDNLERENTEKVKQPKIRFKLYKAGKKWLISASIAVVAGVGSQAVTTQTASASMPNYSYIVQSNALTLNGVDGKIAAKSFVATAQQAAESAHETRQRVTVEVQSFVRKYDNTTQSLAPILQDEKNLFSTVPKWGDEAYKLIGKRDSKSVTRAKWLNNALAKTASSLAKNKTKMTTEVNSICWANAPRTSEASSAVATASSAVDGTEFIMAKGAELPDKSQYSAYNSMAHSFESAASLDSSIADSYVISANAYISAKNWASDGQTAATSTAISMLSATNSYVNYASLAASQPINQPKNKAANKVSSAKRRIKFDKTWHRYWRNVTTLKTFYLKNAQGNLIGSLPIGTKVDVYSSNDSIYVTKPNQKTVLGTAFVDGYIQFDLTDAVVGGNAKYSVHSEKFDLYKSIKNGRRNNLVKYVETWSKNHDKPKSITLGTTVFKQVSIPKNRVNIQDRYKTNQGDIYEIDKSYCLLKNGKKIASNYNVYTMGILGSDLTYTPVVIGQQVYLKVKVQVFDKYVTGYVNTNQFSLMSISNEHFYGGNYK